MKSFLAAAILALTPSLVLGVPVVSEARQVEGQDRLLKEIEVWSGMYMTQPPDRLTLCYKPRLDEIKAQVASAGSAEKLIKTAKDFQEWKESLLRQKFAEVKASGSAGGASLESYQSEQKRTAEVMASVREQIRRSSEGSQFFDGAGAAAPAVGVVTVPPAFDVKDPARYAKVRQILISQGADRRIVDMAIKEAIRQDADPLLVLSVIKNESNFDRDAVSRVGARGLMQIMPATGRDLGVSDSNRLFDAKTNIRAGIRYLKQMWTRFSDVEMASLQELGAASKRGAKFTIAAFNAGPGAVSKYKGVPPYRETRGYVKKVLAYYEKLQQYLG